MLLSGFGKGLVYWYAKPEKSILISKVSLSTNVKALLFMDSPMLQKLPNSEIFCGAHTLPSYILLNYFSMCRLFLTFVHLFIRMVLESEHSGY